jgi:hypothetical protein
LLLREKLQLGPKLLIRCLRGRFLGLFQLGDALIGSLNFLRQLFLFAFQLTDAVLLLATLSGGQAQSANLRKEYFTRNRCGSLLKRTLCTRCELATVRIEIE